MMKGEVKPTLPFDPFAIAQATGDFALGLATRPAGPDAGADGGREAMGRFLDRRAVAASRATRRATAASRRRMAGRRLLPRDPRRLSAGVEAAARPGRRSATATTAAKAMARFLLDQYLNAVSPTNFAADQPRSGQADQGDQRREPGPGFRQPARGHRQRQGHRPAPHRPDSVRKGQDHRRDAGRGGVRKRAVPADPVHADHRKGRGRAAAVRAAPGQPLLHDRPRAAAEPGQMAGRRGPHGVRHQLGQSRPRASRTRASAIMSSKASSKRSSRSRKRTKQRPTCSPSASAGRWSRSRWPGWRPRSRADEVNSATLIGSHGRFRRHARLVGVRPRRPSRRARGPSRGPGIYRQPRTSAAVRGDARQRPDLVVGGQHYLLDRPAPPSDLLNWFEDGARIPAAFLKSYNRDLLLNNKLKEPAGFKVGDVAIELAAIKTPMLVIALKDDHVSAWEAVYAARGTSAPTSSSAARATTPG